MMNLQGPQIASSSNNSNVNHQNNNNIRSIRVIMLRHGEREDETDDYSRHHRCHQDRVDPYLTPFGYRQALHAWKKILFCLEKAGEEEEETPIILASSPLRRCLGTAIMVSAAMSSAAAQPPHRSSSVKVVLPSRQASDDATSPTMIPMLVMNGLGDCAAQMQHMGGIGKVIKAGWLDMAASPSNDHVTANSVTTRFQTCLGSICKVAATTYDESVGVKDSKVNNINNHEQQQQGQSCSSNNSTMGVSSATSIPFQFWRETLYHYATIRDHPHHDLAAMTQAKTLEDHGVVHKSGDDSHSDKNRQHVPTQPMTKNAASAEEQCFQALTRVVLQTAHSKGKTCVLVTHREAIRHVETHWVNNHNHKNNNNTDDNCAGEGSTIQNHENETKADDATRRRTRMSATKLYCCVAIYQVIVDTDTSTVLQWKSKDVVPYQTLQPDHMMF
jgi:Histidine phosphatase superfamily (branch 1)